MENVIILVLVIIIISIFIGGSIMLKIMRGFYHQNYQMPMYPQNVVRTLIPAESTKLSNPIIHLLFIGICVVGLSYLLLEGQFITDEVINDQYVADNQNSNVLVSNDVSSKQYIIQLHSTSNYFEISQWCSYYKQEGFDCFILQIGDNDYKLVIGTYASLNEAKQFESTYFSGVNSWCRLVGKGEVVLSAD
jgi:hypothetical protein